MSFSAAETALGIYLGTTVGLCLAKDLRAVAMFLLSAFWVGIALTATHLALVYCLAPPALPAYWIAYCKYFGIVNFVLACMLMLIAFGPYVLRCKREGVESAD